MKTKYALWGTGLSSAVLFFLSGVCAALGAPYVIFSGIGIVFGFAFLFFFGALSFLLGDGD